MTEKVIPGDWIVKVKCTVVKQLVVSGCTKDEAYDDPYDYEIEDEMELEQIDFEVLDVEPNR